MVEEQGNAHYDDQGRFFPGDGCIHTGTGAHAEDGEPPQGQGQKREGKHPVQRTLGSSAENQEHKKAREETDQ